MTMRKLQPSLAAQAAKFAYDARTATSKTIVDLVPDTLEPEFDFSGNLISGVSGTVFERLFNHRTGFGVIGQGRAKSAYRGHHLVAMRGTALGRDAVTDMHCGVSAAPNNKPSHVGFNRTFNSMLPALHSYFDKAPQGPVHCVGHSLGGALANLTANWLRAAYAAERRWPVNLCRDPGGDDGHADCLRFYRLPDRRDRPDVDSLRRSNPRVTGLYAQLRGQANR